MTAVATKRATVAVAMSGGVDSSVAAALLLPDYDIIGLTMHLWTDPKGTEMALNRASGCCSITMSHDAAAVAEQLGFKHYVLNLSEEFHRDVVHNFAQEYFAGRTPNPCVRCNSLIKWQTLLERAQRLDCDYIATGHYARISQCNGRYELRKSRFTEKDQSYALWGLSQDNLAHTLFPLGDISKPDVRKIAADLGLKTADKPESQDICFVPDDDYRRFLHDNYPEESHPDLPGEIIGPAGKVLGQHSGLRNYTIGQRKGMGIAADRPLYVTKIDILSNRVFADYDDGCFSQVAIVENVNWVSIACPTDSISCEVKVRYRDTPHAATLIPLADGRVRIEFLEPVRAITPGQSAVFYAGDLLLGGGLLTNHQEETSHE